MSLRTTLCVRYPPEIVAVGCIYVAARMLQIPLPEEPEPWWELFDATIYDIEEVCRSVLSLYSRPKSVCINVKNPKYTNETFEDDEEISTPNSSQISYLPIAPSVPQQPQELLEDIGRKEESQRQPSQQNSYLSTLSNSVVPNEFNVEQNRDSMEEKKEQARSLSSASLVLDNDHEKHLNDKQVSLGETRTSNSLQSYASGDHLKQGVESLSSRSLKSNEIQSNQEKHKVVNTELGSNISSKGEKNEKLRHRSHEKEHHYHHHHHDESHRQQQQQQQYRYRYHHYHHDESHHQEDSKELLRDHSSRR